MTTIDKFSGYSCKPTRITIRQFRTSDLAKVMQIERGAFPDAWDENWFMYFYEFNPSGFVVAVAGRERVVGYALIDIEGEGEEAWLSIEQGKLTPARGHLLNIAVDEEWRNKGIGGLLLDAATRYALQRGVDEIWLEVQMNNTNAIRFYSKRGFKSTGQILRNYYPDGGDASVMRKKLVK
nr:ribosomal protein S18-alanine N-acetyltransferase [Candidatus Njordarchaeota archaeon]